MRGDLFFSVEEATDCLQAITNNSGSRYSTAKRLYEGSRDHGWLGLLLDVLSGNPKRQTRVFGGQTKELADSLLRLAHALTLKDNPSALMRFVGALAYRDLDVLSQLEGITHLVRDAASREGWQVPIPNKHKKPLKDHVLHTACDLDAGYRLLAVEDATGTPVFKRLFKQMMTGLHEVFPRLEADLVRRDVEALGDEGIRGFVEDCWIATALIHDLGYLHMLGLLLLEAYGGTQLGPNGRSAAKASSLHEWLEKLTLAAEDLLVDKEGNATQVAGRHFCLPALDRIWADRDPLESPTNLHGYVSGYVLLEALLANVNGPHPTHRRWDSLGKAERCIAVIAAAACGFHSDDIFSHCEKKLTDPGSIDWAKAREQLTNDDNPVRLHLLEKRVNVPRLLTEVEAENHEAINELTKELNSLIEVQADSRTSKQAAAKHAMIGPAYRELLEARAEECTEALNLFRKSEKSALSPDRVNLLNRFVLETALAGAIPGSLQQAWESSWRYNPMGVYLYAVDSIQECVRLAWERLDWQRAESDPKIVVRIPGSPKRPDGLIGAVAQCPIPQAVLRIGAFKNNKRRPGIEFQKSRTKLFVTTPTGAFDFDLLVGSQTDVQKRRNIPIAIKLITSYSGLSCFTSNPSRGSPTPNTNRERAFQIAENLRRVLVRGHGLVGDEKLVDGAPVVVDFDTGQKFIIKDLEKMLGNLKSDSEGEQVAKCIGGCYMKELEVNPPSRNVGQPTRRENPVKWHRLVVKKAFEKACERLQTDLPFCW